MSNSDNSSSNAVAFEKIALTIFTAIILTVMTWVGLTVNQNQLQYARIEERLSSQSVILKDLQNKFTDSTQWRSRIETEMALFNQRLMTVEQKESK
ncbi:hypothetical protein [Pseudoalteromonas rhizosphaerae]|uniref:hypothetical protein n=1 Tax=Pseudoalteromonas rhizosphaerae TaxID=2518973 RepID=UPI001231284B|nr:hypothetical protein [Pseudoalteromonas rhizosphaerae]